MWMIIKYIVKILIIMKMLYIKIILLLFINEY